MSGAVPSPALHGTTDASPDPSGRPLRVMHVLSRDALGGTELITVALAARSPAFGVESTVVILDEPGPIAERLLAAGVTVHSLGKVSRQAAMRAVTRLVRQGGVDVLCGYGFRTGVLTRLVGRAASRKVKTVTGVHGLFVTEIESLETPRGRFVMAVERVTSPLVDAYVANSPGAMEVLAAHGIARRRLGYIPNGIEADLWTVPDRAGRTGPPTVICAARFAPVKRQADLVAAAALLRDRGVDFRMVFAGTGPLMADAQAQAAAAELDGIVQFLGAVAPTDMAATLAAADVASLVSSQEGMPGAVMEAMASGLPIVGTRVNGIKDLVVDGETGRLTPAADPVALADALEPLLRDQALRLRQGAAARRRIVEEFSLDSWVERTCQLHHRVHAGPSAPRPIAPVHAASRKRTRDVAFYAPWASPNLTAADAPSGGAEVQVVHLARGLAARGRRVGLFTYAIPGLPDEVDGITILRQRRPDWSFAPARRAVVLLGSILGLMRLDSGAVVQRSGGAATGLVGLTSRLTRTRFVFSSASTADFSFETYGYGRATNALYRLGVRLADEVVVQTEEQAQMCRDEFGRDPVVIRSVAEPAGEPRPTERSAGFLWIGRLASYKNPDAFLDLAAAVPDAPFTMVCVPADDAGAAVLAGLTARAEGISNLTLLGPQSRPAMMERIADATAIVSTSIFEGMPNTLIEGWSRGVPALTLSHDPDGVIEREGLGTCAHGNPGLLAEHTRELWEHRADGDALRRHCREYARRAHHPDAVLAQWERVLREADAATA